MTDIVKRLRTLISHARDSGMKTETLEDAEREIERLRRALRDVMNASNDPYGVARSALSSQERINAPTTRGEP